MVRVGFLAFFPIIYSKEVFSLWLSESFICPGRFWGSSKGWHSRTVWRTLELALGSTLFFSPVWFRPHGDSQSLEGRDIMFDSGSLCYSWHGWWAWQILTTNQVTESCRKGLCDRSLFALSLCFPPNPKAAILPSFPSVPLQKPEWKETWKQRGQVSWASSSFHEESSLKNKPVGRRGGGWLRQEGADSIALLPGCIFRAGI